MTIKSLTLHNFRSYEHLELEFSDGLNLITGPNGVGKSNLAEAVHYLSLAKSWRSNEDRLLIREGQPSAYLKAVVEEGGLSREIEIEIARNSKRISVNGKKIAKLSELSKLVNVIIFSPEDVKLFADSPGQRRRFLDLAIAKKSPEYMEVLSSYNKLLGDRNAMLKDGNPDCRLLTIITSRMVEISEAICRARAEYVAKLNTVLPKIIDELSGGGHSAELTYRSYAKLNEDFQTSANAAFERALEGDCRHGSTSVGPQREDIRFLFNGRDVAEFGSQGENRISVLSLEIAPYFLIEEREKKPICVLDDVFSELDESRSGALLGFIKSLSQVFVTATKLETDGASIYEVSPEGINARRN